MFRIKAIYGGAALSLCMILSACGGGQKSDEIVRPVKTIKAGVSSPIETTVLSGTVCAEIEANPAFRISGVLERVYVKEGQYIEEGQLIAELDTRNAKEAAEAAKSKYEQVSAEVARVEELYKRQSVAKNEYEKAISGRQSVTSLYNTAQNNLKDSKLYSPISGIVQSVNYAPKQMVTPAGSIVSIINTSSLNIESYLSSSLFMKQDKFIRFVATSSLSTDSIPLKLVYSSPKGNNNQLYKIRLDIDPKYRSNLAPGMVVEVKLFYKRDTNDELTIPLNSLFEYQGDTYVWCVDTGTMTVNRKLIFTDGTSKIGDVIVKSGLTGDELIVAAGVTKLKEGDKVKLQTQKPLITD